MNKTENKTKIARFARPIGYSLIAAVVILGAGRSRMLAQQGSIHTNMLQAKDSAQEQKNKAQSLVDIVRKATERYQDVSVAEKAGYSLQFGCVSGPDSGAMGMHFVNGDLVNDGLLDPTRPEIVIYEPQPNGSLKLIGADFL